MDSVAAFEIFRPFSENQSLRTTANDFKVKNKDEILFF
jgi:hypothetical protein